ncbi:MAG: hypothetical protein HOM58_08865 [Rhodospirillaceae bacterium]|jgi:hypothetical protein|nr:hypothetical protein [Rhodospirillaceae bacterium]MBT5456228.1 hypothetical protein [Rhodospirillaceae bacterium]
MAGRLLLYITLVTAMSGCQQTTYREMGAVGKADSQLERRVDYRLGSGFYANAPDCAALRTRTRVPRAFRDIVEQSVERHLATRLMRVIGPVRLRRAESRLGIDMGVVSDRRVFARQARCPALVEIALHEISDDYFVLWAQRGIAMTLTMTRIADGKILWSARHRASRSDGGIPLSLLSLPFSAARAARFKNDPELFASIADDAVRRMMKTLPDTREHGFTGRSLGVLR